MSGRDSTRQDPASALLVVRPGPPFDAVATHLRGRGLRPLLVPSAGGGLASLYSIRPRVVVIDARVERWQTLLTVADSAGAVCVVVGDWRQLGHLEGRRGTAFGVLAPSDADELVAVVEVALAARDTAAPAVVDLDGVVIDLASCTVTVDGREVALPPKEYALLEQLVANAGRPVPARQLIARVWPDAPWTLPQDLHWHVWRLRTLLGDRDRPTPLIRNRRGYGYVLDAPVSAAA